MIRYTVFRPGRAVALQGPHCTVFAGPHDADHEWELHLIEQGEQGAWALWGNAVAARRAARGSKRTTKAATRRTGSRSPRKAPSGSPYARVHLAALERRRATGGGSDG